MRRTRRTAAVSADGGVSAQPVSAVDVDVKVHVRLVGADVREDGGRAFTALQVSADSLHDPQQCPDVWFVLERRGRQGRDVLLRHDDDVFRPVRVGVLEGQHQIVLVDHLEWFETRNRDIAVEVVAYIHGVTTDRARGAAT